MNSKIIVNGLTPVKSVDKNNAYEVSVWNRTYTISESPFFSSILTAGQEVLASPIRLGGRSFNKDIVWENFENYEMTEGNDKEITFVQATKFRELILNTSFTVCYDGLVKCNVKLTPEGYHRGRIYGRTTTQEELMVLDKLYLEIPFKKEFAKFYHINPEGVTYVNGKAVDKEVMSLNTMNFVPSESLILPFKHTVYLGNDTAGLGVFFESDEGWNNKDTNNVIEILNQEDCVLLRVHLLDKEHKKWMDKGEFNGGFLHPIVFEFGMQATPVKPMPKNQYVQKAFHTHGVFETKEGRQFLLDKPMPDATDDEMMIDALARQGVEYVYVHERWNDLQNSFYLTKNTAERLKYMVKLAHDRGMKIIPYFGFEISSLSPEFDKSFMKYKVKRNQSHYDFMRPSYVRTPHQRDLSVCYKSGYSQIFLDGVAKLMDEYGFDGIYLDGTYSIESCQNLEHGCGYVDENGVVHSTAPIFTIRNMFEKLYEIVNSRGGIINIHTGNNFPVPFLAFADSIWDGEVIQPYLISGKLDSIPEGHFRSVYTGRPLGIFANVITYTNNPTWTYHQALSTIIAYGVLSRPQNNLEQLNEIAKVWQAYDDIGVETATFKPCYDNDVKISSDKLKVSYFENEKAILAIIANAYNSPSGKTEITFNGSFKTATNKMTGEKVELLNGNTITVEFENFDYLLIKLDK